MTMTMKKVLATGLGAAALLVLTTGNAKAAVLTLQINNGIFTDGAAFSGNFTYNTTTNTYSNWNLVAPAGTTVTRNFTYTNANSSTAASFPSSELVDVNSASYFSVSALAAYTPQGTAPGARNYNTIALGFTSALSNLTGVGQGKDIDLPVSFDGSRNGFNNQQRALTGGTVVVTQFTPSIAAVPEPLTILGAATAVGFGAAFKRRVLKSNKSA